MNLVTLETNRLFLTGLSPADINTIFTTLPKDEIKKVLGHRSEEEYRSEEYKHLNGYAAYNRSCLLFLLTDKETGRIIGRCGLHNWNKDHRRAEIGYIMHEDSFKRKGLMTEAVKAIIAYGFNELKLHRIEAITATDNIASISILQNNHFTKEGILRQHVYAAGNYEDSILFSLLENEMG